MLVVPIAAGPELLRFPELAGARRQRAHAEIANLIAVHGCLVFPDVQRLEEFRRAVHELEPRARESWEAHLEVTRIRVCDRPPLAPRPIPRPLSQLSSADDVRAWAQWAGVACVHPDVWAVLLRGEAATVASQNFTFKKPPPARLIEVMDAERGGVTYAEALLEAQRRRNEVAIGPGTSRNWVAMNYLTPVIRWGVRITIVDKYLASELVRWRPADDGPPALEWLLELIDDHAEPTIARDGSVSGCDVTVYTTHEDERSHTRLRTVLDGLMERALSKGPPAHRPSGLHSVTVFSMPRYGYDVEGDRTAAGIPARLIEVGHGVEANRYGEMRARFPDATTHLSLARGLTPLRLGGYHEGWDISYSAPALNPETHNERFRAVSSEAVAQAKRPPLGTWTRHTTDEAAGAAAS